jgi:hypothetical protein
MQAFTVIFSYLLQRNLMCVVKKSVLFIAFLSLLPVSLQSAEIDSEVIPLVTISSLITSSRTLVKEAATGTTNATRFRIDATLFRESLRSFMLEREKSGNVSDGISTNDLMNLVRMSALLQSAADCKTGRYIVCPPELMQQLRSQQDLIDKLFGKPG